MKLLTNNPRVLHSDQFPKNVEIQFVETDYLGVLHEVSKEVIENKCRLLTHPLSSSLKPNETYYKSVLLQDTSSSQIDLESLEMIERAIMDTEKFLASKKTPEWTERVLNDFQVIDYSIIQGALEHSAFADYALKVDDE